MRIEDFSNLFNTNKEKVIKQIPEHVSEDFSKMLESKINENDKFIPFTKDNFMSDNSSLKEMFAFFNYVLSNEDSNDPPTKADYSNLKSLIGQPTNNDDFFSFESLPQALKTQIKNAVDETSAKFGIPKELIYAIIDQESSFNPYLVNHNKDGTTDRGLMQVNYDHNIDLMKQAGITDKNQLFDIKTNIALGTEILKKDFEKYGSWPLAIKAYNGINADNWNYVKSVISKIPKYKNIG